MVTWQKMVSIAFDTAESKGAKFSGIEDGGQFLSELSTLWQQDKQSILQMTEVQVQQYLSERIET